MSNEPRYVLCSFWEDRQIESVKRSCVDCGRDLAMDAMNVRLAYRAELVPICLECVARQFADKPEDFGFAGGIIGGKFYPKVTDMFAALRERVAKERKKEGQ